MERFIQRIPKTFFSWALAWALVIATAVRYFKTGDAPDSTWLAFLGGILGAAVVQHVGTRAATKAEVVRAEAEAIGAAPADRLSEDGP